MKKIKVLHLTSSPRGIGGVERLLLDMARHFDASRLEVVHCNLFCEEDGNGIFASALKATGLPYLTIKGRRWFELPQMALRLWRLLGSEQIDVLHLHMLHATILGGFVAIFRTGVRTIVTRHYTSILIKKRVLRWLDTFFTRRADRVVAISEYVKEDLFKAGIAPEKVTVVYNGTDIEAFDQAAREDIDTPDGSPLIGTVGSLTKRKGHEFLLRAMPEVLREFPNARLAIVGEGPEEATLCSLIRKAALDSCVTLVGFRKNVAPFLCKLDLYVHPSLLEPFGISILEAMAAARCVVACAVEGVPELIVDGETGILVPPADPSKLAEAICHVLRDSAECRKMGEAGRHRVLAEFSLERAVERYEHVYLDATDTKLT